MAQKCSLLSPTAPFPWALPVAAHCLSLLWDPPSRIPNFPQEKQERQNDSSCFQHCSILREELHEEDESFSRLCQQMLDPLLGHEFLSPCVLIGCAKVFFPEFPCLQSVTWGAEAQGAEHLWPICWGGTAERGHRAAEELQWFGRNVPAELWAPPGGAAGVGIVGRVWGCVRQLLLPSHRTLLWGVWGVPRSNLVFCHSNKQKFVAGDNKWLWAHKAQLQAGAARCWSKGLMLFVLGRSKV